jgi:polar amino acid transport system substrate-binding protein
MSMFPASLTRLPRESQEVEMGIRSLFLACVLWLLAAACWAQQETLNVVLSNQEYPPYLGEELPDYGLLSKVVTEAFRLENVNVTYAWYPNNRTLQSARTGAVDGSLGWAITPDRQKDLLYTDPVMSLRMVFFQRVDKKILWSAMRDLAPYRIGVTAGNTYSEDFMRLQQTGVLHTQEVGDDVLNMRKLLAKHIDLFPIDAEVGAMLVARTFSVDQRKLLIAQPRPFWIAPLHVVIWKKQPHAAELVQRFNLGLAALHRSGEFDRLIIQTRRRIYAGSL